MGIKAMKDCNSIYKWQQKQQKKVSAATKGLDSGFPVVSGIYIELELTRASLDLVNNDDYWRHRNAYEDLFHIFEGTSPVGEIITDEEDDRILDFIESVLSKRNYYSTPNNYCFVHFKNKIGIFLKGQNIIPSNRGVIVFYTKDQRPLGFLIKKLKRFKIQTSQPRFYSENGYFPDWNGNMYYVRGVMKEMFGWE